ncbi:hypothetical protein EIP91_002587 [Steccherinum ochraceum]|uniref:RRM domain-containing protein n=1 Tax=Steccherinum ochraceum TaxID=92696 RepID=A0A4R0RKB3_9APHY|nr:hypothetical protein EIP91_002587 [Steccherinum ochraceum]
MNRHHPYGGGYDGGGRRGGPPGGFGPDRSHRFNDRGGPSRGRGFGRGRGGPHYGGGYDNAPLPYEQGPPQGDMGGYNSYESGPPQDNYYQNQNGSFNGGMPAQYGSSDMSGGYDQGYGNHEDGSGYYEQGQGGYARGGKRGGGPRREREEKLPDAVIEERIQRERPCRTLFIRNIKASVDSKIAAYETNSDDVRRLFEEHGEIRTFFDLISGRGMVFVTYFDLRAAERARERLQGSQITGRPIDVHYSLPRDDHKGDKEKAQQLQGTLLVTLRDSATGQDIDDNEVRRKFQQFGDVKSVRPANERPDQRYVEFFDTRASDEAHDRLRHQGLQDGVMEIAFAGDNSIMDPSKFHDRGPSHASREWDDYAPRGGRGRGRGRGRGGRGGGGGWGSGGGGGGGGDDWDHRGGGGGGRGGGDWGRDRDRGRPFEDEYGREIRPGFDDRFDGRGGGYDNRGGDYGAPPGPPQPGPSGYNGGPPPPFRGGGYDAPPANIPPPPLPPAQAEDRLSQAKQVQQLLAALKQPGAPAAGSPPPPAVMQSPPAQNAAAAYYPPPPGMRPPFPGTVPPLPAPPAGAPGAPPGYPPMPSQPAAPPGGTATPPTNAFPNIPPNVLALLQGSGTPTQQQSTNTSTSVPTYNMPPPVPAPSVPGVSAGSPLPAGGYGDLMAYLQVRDYLLSTF